MLARPASPNGPAPMDESTLNPQSSQPVHPEPSPPPRIGLLAALRRNLAGGLRLLIPGRVGGDRFVRTFDQAALLLILSLLVWAGLDRLHAQTDAVLQLDGLFGWAAYLLVGLVGGALVARAQ